MRIAVTEGLVAAERTDTVTSVDPSERPRPAAYHPSGDRAEHHAGNENWRIGLRNDRVRDAREHTDQNPGCDR